MGKKVRVVHLISGLQVGGAETVLYELANALDRRSFEQIVVYFNDGPFVQKIEELGISTYQVTGLFLKYDFIFVYRLFKLIKYLRPTCLHTVLWSAGFWGKLLGHFYKIPTVHANHNTVKYDGLVRNSFDRLLSRWVDQTVAVSDGIAASLKIDAPWMKGHAVTVIKNGIDVDQIMTWSKKEKKSRAALGYKKEHFIIGAVGRFERSKNFSLLLTSFALLYDNYRHARLVLIGSGPQEDFLKDRASLLGISDRVQFISGERAYGYYPLFDCFVSSSLTEGLSVALLEAISCGVAPIVSGANREHEVIKNKKTGLVCEVGNAYQLADSMALYMDDKQLRAQLGKAAQRDAELYFNAEVMVQKYANLYQTLSDKRRTRVKN